MTTVGVDRSIQTNPWDFDDDGGGPPPPLSPSPTLSDGDLRAAADARYQAFAVGQGDGGTTTAYCYRRDANYDHCVTETIPDAVAFAKEGGDVDLVDAKDVRQGTLGDCALMASLCALTTTPQGRALIKNAIAENKDASGAVTSYTVTLHKPETHFLGLGATTYPAVQVKVTAPFVVGHAGGPAGSNEIWPAIIEKAYAQIRGGYDAVGHKGVVEDAIPILTGFPSESVSLHQDLWSRLTVPAFTADRLQGALATGHVVVLSSLQSTENADGNHGLHGQHAYAVTGTEERDGQLFVNLKNPWGVDDPAPVPFNELTQWFGRVDIARVP